MEYLGCRALALDAIPREVLGKFRVLRSWGFEAQRFSTWNSLFVESLALKIRSELIFCVTQTF